MALVGEAHIIVKAITTGVERDIRNGFQNIEGTGTEAGKKLGRSYGSGFLDGYKNSKANNVFKRVADGIRAQEEAAERARRAFSKLTTMNLLLGPPIYALLGGISQLVVAIGAMAAAAVGAAGSMALLGSALVSVKVGMAVAKFALGGVGAAVKQASQSGNKYTKTLKEMREELQQLRFDAEDAALGEKEAALNLEKARLNLLRMQDLPPNSVARREAELEYEKAELAYRRAKDKNADLKDEVKKGLDGVKAKNKSGGGGADPFANLTASQKKFAQYLISIQGQFKDLREVAAKGFLPKLQEGIEGLMKTQFPVLKTGIGSIASSMGDAAKEFSALMGTEANQKVFGDFLAGVSTNLKPLGRIVAAVFGGILRFLNAAQPVMEPFLKSVEDTAKAFENWTITNKNGITDFLGRARIMADKLGNVFGNVFGGLGKIIDENTKPGSGGYQLISWLETATAGFKNINETFKGKDGQTFSEYFQQAAEGGKAILQIIGGILGSFLKLAGNPKVTEFFTTLQKGLEKVNLDDMFADIAETLPTLAGIILDIVEALNALSNSGAVKFFFGVIKAASGFLKVAAPILGWALVILGPLIGLAKGLFFVGKGFRSMWLVGLGLFNFIRKFFPGFKKGATSAADGTKKLDKGVKDVDRDVKKMNRAIAASEKAFKGLNRAVTAFNKVLQTLATKAKAATGALAKVKTAATNGSNGMKKLKTESNQAANKLKRVETEGKKAKTSLDKMKTSADKARTSLQKLGKTKSAPGIGGGMPGAGGAGGAGGGGINIPILGGFGGKGGGLVSKLLKNPVIGKGGPWVAAAAAIPVLVDMAAEGADAARVTTRQMEALAKANGGFGASSEKVAKRLTDVADSMGGLTGQNFENVKSVQSLLLKYPALAREADKVGGKFDKVTGLALDLASVFGTDAPSAAQVMADAMADPTTALDTLTGAGVRFTDAETKKYEEILKTNGAGAAQDYMLDTLTEKYGGYAQKNADANDKIAARWDTMGRKISEWFQPFNDWISRGLLWLIESLFGGEKSDTSKKIDVDLGNFNASLAKNAQKGMIGYRPMGTFADGGTIYPSPGGSVIRVAEAGQPERVEPLDKNGLSKRDIAMINLMGGNTGGGINMNIYASPDMDVNALASEVSRKIAFQMRKGAI